MTIADGAARALRLVVGTLLPIAAVGLGGYFLYRSHREAAFVALEQRALADVREQLRARLDALAQAIATHGRTCTRPPSADATAPAEPPAPVACAREAELLGVSSHVTLPKGTSFSPAGADGTRVAIVPDAGGSIYLAWDRDCARGSCVEEPVCVPGRTICAQLRLDAVVRPLLADSPRFDIVALSIDGTVVAMHSSLTRDLRDDVERALADAPSTAVPADADAKWRVDLGGWWTRGHPPKKVDGEPFYVFSEPIVSAPHAATGTPAPRAVRIDGLVRASVFARHVNEIPNAWLLVLLLVVVLACLAWPLLKLWYMSPEERLQGLDVRVLVLSMLLATGIVTMTLLQVRDQQVLGTAFDRQMGELAGALEARLTAHLAEAHATLAGPLADDTRVWFQAFTQIVRFGWDAMPWSRTLLDRNDDGGRLRSGSLPDLRVDDREYYRDLKAGRRLWRATPPFTAEVVQSKTDSTATLVLALRESPDGQAPAGDGGRLIATHITPWRDPVLPYGFGFAFVDEDGRVQLHVDARRNAVEHLPDACSGDDRIRAAILHAPAAATSAPIEVTYDGVPRRLVVHRLADEAPWRLVMFRERRLLSVVNDEVIGTWSVLYLAYLGAFLVLLLLVQIVHDGYRAPWLWPDRTASSLYVGAAVQLATTVVFALAAHTALVATRGAEPFLLAVAIAAAVLGTLCRALGEPRRGVLAEGERRLAALVVPAASAAIAVLLLMAGHPALALAIGPLAAAWRPSAGGPDRPVLRPSQVVAVATVLGVVALDALTWPSRWPILVPILFAPGWLPIEWMAWRQHPAVQSVATRVAARLVLPRATEAGFRWAYVVMLSVLLALVAGVPAAVFQRDAHRQVVAELHRFMQRDLQRAVDARAAAGRAQVTPVAPEGAAVPEDGVYRTAWVDGAYRGPVGGLAALATRAFPGMPDFGPPTASLRAMVAEADREGGKATHPPAVPVPGASRDSITAVVVLLWLAVGGIGVGVIWSIARLVFLLDVDRDARDEMPPRGTVIVWTLHARQPKLGATPSATLDLRQPQTTDTIEKFATDKPATAHPYVQVDHLECVLADTAMHDAVLKLLEQLVRVEGRSVVLTSAVDPVRVAFGRMQEAVAEHAARERRGADAAAIAAAATAADAAVVLVDRWTRLLEVFERRRCEVRPRPATAVDPADPFAGRYAALVDGAPSPDTDEQYAPHYWQLWRQCTHAEQLALRHLAEEGFLNPNSTDVVRPLMRRLLVRRDPAFSLTTEGFRRFVLSAVSPDTVAEWERPATPSAWARLRNVLMALAALAVAYLVVVQPDVLNWGIALATAVAAGLPAILQAFKVVGDQRTGSGAR